MPLSVKDGMGAWIKDFQKSDAPQFKGKSDKERREMAMAAYLSAKDGGKNEANELDENKSALHKELLSINRKIKLLNNPTGEDLRSGRMSQVKKRSELQARKKEILSKLKEEVKPPFTPDPPSKNKPRTNSDGSKTSPMSRAKQLAKMARDRNMKKESVELEEKYSWNDVNKALTKANYMRGNPAHINKVASKFDYKSGNDKKFTLADVKKNLSAAGIDASRHHNVMKHMKESTQIDEAMTSAIMIDDFFSMDDNKREKLAKLAKKHNLKTPIEKRGRKNVAVVDGNKRMMQKFEKELKRMGVKFTATESVELGENVKKAYEIMKPTKSMNHGIAAIKKHMKVDHNTATNMAKQVMDKVKKGEFKEAKDSDQKFKDHLKFATSKSPAVQAYMKKRKADRDAMNKKNDPNAAKKGYALTAVPPERKYQKLQKAKKTGKA